VPMKWFLFALSLFSLLVAYNALFMLPGSYDWFGIAVAAVAILAAAVCAWFSGRRFASKQATWRELMLTPPAVIWLFVLLLFCCAGFIRVVAYYWRR